MRRVAKLLLFISIALVSCHTRKNLQPAAYIAYLENDENGFRKKIDTKSAAYTIQLATPEYMASREYLSEKNQLDSIAKRVTELKGHIFFLINIVNKLDANKTQIGNSDQRAIEMNGYYGTQAAADISLIDSSGEAKPETYVFENNYGLTPYNTILIGFKKPDLTNCQIVFNDQLNGNLFIKATYSEPDLKLLPVLVTK